MLLKDRRCISKRSKCLRKSDREITDVTATILSRWYASEPYRNSLYAIGWREKHIMLYDRIVLEKYNYVATKVERIQITNNWILTEKSERETQHPLNHRPDFAQANRECKRLHDEHLARTEEEYREKPRSQQVRQRKGQQFEDFEEYDYAVDPKTSWRFYKRSRGNLQTTSSKSRANLPTTSSSSSKWDQTLWKTSN